MDLQIGLKIHLHGLIDREKKHAVLEDIFKDEIQRKYPLVFEMGIFVVEFLEKKDGYENFRYRDCIYCATFGCSQ
ncbi:PRD domain-containing protein [Mediterraneibacter gnavus]|uniref:PRD domain-containing protein n=1 Tax=Mediterraneibacter gnavus TaxID=33038 RepID=UPI001FA7AEC0